MERVSMGGALLEFSGVRKTYGGVRALDGVDIALFAGEVQCLAGGNGSGKSTLIKILSGVETPDTGALLRVDGRLRRHWTASQAVREGIEVIYQDLSLFPNLSVGENVALSRWVAERRFWARLGSMRGVAAEALARIGVELEVEARVSEISLAEQQLVAIARALTANPRMLIMDEPTTALTRREIDALFGVVGGLVAQGIGVLFVSHKLDEVLEVATRVTVLRDGRKVGDYAAGELSGEELGNLISGTEVGRWEHVSSVGQGASVLKLEGLCRRGQFERIDLEVRAGEVVGLTGLLGSGRTELALALFGLNATDGGEVYTCGQRVRIRSVQEAMKLGIAYVPEDRAVQGLVLDHSVGWNLTLPMLDRMKGRWGLLSSRLEVAMVEASMKRFGIRTAGAGMPVATLSGGNQQRVVLGKWLETKPRLLILDGPTVGIDVGARRDVHGLIRRHAGAGVGVLLISDEIPEVLEVTDRFYVMRRGRLIGEYDSRKATMAEVRALLEGPGGETEAGVVDEPPGADGR
jgi:simple sugar transport system ATP-binding protein